jgi:peptidyl-dipeptidase Dcp
MPINISLPADNPFAHASTLPYQAPPLDRIRDEHFEPAFTAGMAEQRREIDAITDNPQAPSFANTIIPLEQSGLLLSRTSAVFSSLTASNTNDELEALQTELSPKLAAHSDWIFLHEALFSRVRALHEQRSTLALDAESLRLLERYYILFVRAGAKLSESDKTKLRQFNEQLSTLATQFLQTVLKGVNASAVKVDSLAELDGLSAEQIATAAAAAHARKLDGKPTDQWVIALINTTGQPPLAQLKSRALRERIYKISRARGVGGEFDTTQIVAHMVKLRAERATLLGYANHAAYVLEDETALTTNAVNQMLAQLAPPAIANAKREAVAIQTLIDAQAKTNGTQSFQLQPWDWDFYAEQVRAEKYAYDVTAVRPYFEMNRVLRDGVLYAAQMLYGIVFKERRDIPVYQSDMLVFEVLNADGSSLGLLYMDWYARANKRGGAWMSSYVDQSRLLGLHAVVSNNLNIAKPPQGQPTLMSFDEVITAFHEMGHALHGLFSAVQYPQFSGTNVPRDFVEFPSQYNEMWATDPQVLGNYAKHYQTGESMPKELMSKVLAARKFNQGFATSEYLAAAIVDQAWHQITADAVPSADAVEAFEATALRQAGMDFQAVPPRYRSTYFSHVFSSATGYSAGYYAYIWSDVLARASEHWFRMRGSLQRADGDHLRATVLSKGFSVDALVQFKSFYGKDPEIAPLLEARGLGASSLL